MISGNGWGVTNGRATMINGWSAVLASSGLPNEDWELGGGGGGAFSLILHFQIFIYKTITYGNSVVNKEQDFSSLAKRILRSRGIKMRALGHK
jgi:hypothetical protein